MTTKELNDKIAALAIRERDPHMLDYIEQFKDDYRLLYYSDDQFIQMNKKSVLIMLRLNVRYRIIAFHNFGLFINLDKL